MPFCHLALMLRHAHDCSRVCICSSRWRYGCGRLLSATHCIIYPTYENEALEWFNYTLSGSIWLNGMTA